MPKINFRDRKVQAGAAGAVAVAGFALYKRHQAGANPTSSTVSGSAPDPTGAASALGDANMQSAVYGSLEDQIGGLNGQLSGLQSIVTGLQNAKVPVATGTPIPGPIIPGGPPVTKPGPQPPQGPPPGSGVSGTGTPGSKTPPPLKQSLPPIPAGTLKIPGEKIVGQVLADTGKGGYYLTNFGGVYAVGGAPFLGAANGITHGLLPSNLFKTITTTPQGGYAITNSVGQTQTFNPGAPKPKTTPAAKLAGAAFGIPRGAKKTA